MKKILFLLFILTFIAINACFADDNLGLRDYKGIEISKGTFIPVINSQEISTVSSDVGSKVNFLAATDLYLYNIDIIPQNSVFSGYVEKINEPVVGTNASMIIKVNKLTLRDGFEIPVNGYIYNQGSTLIGGELTEPATYDKKASYREGFYTMTGYVPGAIRKMGENKVIASGADLIIILKEPLYITHTVTN